MHICPKKLETMLIFFQSQSTSQKCIRIASNKRIARIYNSDYAKICIVKPLKEKQVQTVLNDFIEIVNKSSRKPNKLRVDQGKEFIINLCRSG